METDDYIPLAESMDIGSVINKKLIAASHIYQFLLDADVSNVKCLTFANADVAELVARPDSKITRKQVKDMNLPKGTLVMIVKRGDEFLIPNGTLKLHEGDKLLLISEKSKEEDTDSE